MPLLPSRMIERLTTEGTDINTEVTWRPPSLEPQHLPLVRERMLERLVGEGSVASTRRPNGSKPRWS